MRWILALTVQALVGQALAQEPVEKPEVVLPYIDEVEQFQQRVFDVAVPSVVVINNGGSIGTGFFVTAEGLILTNRHVVGSARSVKVETYDGGKLDGSVVEIAEGELDLALVRVAGGPHRPLKMAPLAKLRVGSWAATIGHGYGGVWTFTAGMISNIYPVGEDKPIVQTQIPVNPGNSGGPILDKNGHAVAVVTAKVQAADNINFSIRLDVAFKSLRLLAESCECLVIRTVPDVPVFMDGLLVGKGPRVLMPTEPGVHEVVVPASGGIQRSVTFPQTKSVDLFPNDVEPQTVEDFDGRDVALRVWTLDFDRPNDLTVAPRLLKAWNSHTVTVQRRDGTKVQGMIEGFRPPATLRLKVADGSSAFLSLWDIKVIQRR